MMASIISSTHEDPQMAYEDLEAPMPACEDPWPTCEDSRLAYEDPDAPMPAYEDLDTLMPIYEDLDASEPAVTDGSRSEANMKHVPWPRPKVQHGSVDASDSGDQTNSSASATGTQENEDSTDCKKPYPVRPPPRPPMSKLISSRSASAIENQYIISNGLPSGKPPVVQTEQTKPPPSRPERPPPPSIYYGRMPPSAATPLESETEVCQPSTCSSISSKQDPVSSVLPEEAALSRDGTCAKVATGSKGKPAVPPRPRQHLLPSCASECGPSPTQRRPPTPPPLCSLPASTGAIYSEVEKPHYLEILPSEDKMRRRRSTLHSEPNGQSSYFSHDQSKDDTDEVNTMVRWLKKVSRPDYMSPSVYGLSIEEEIRSFEQRAADVSKALRLFNLLMMRRCESLRSTLTEFTSISDGLDKLQRKNKTMGIAGGATGAVGGVTAVVGIALAPVTMGASLIATAVGAGMVASAGGMGAHTAKANKKIVNRSTVEKLVGDYRTNVVDLEQCLEFILSGMNELRRHDIARLQRAGARSEAVRGAHLAQAVFSSNVRTPTAPTGGMSSERLLVAFSKEMDQYFTDKDSQKLKKLNKSKFSGRVRLLAQNLQDELDLLSHMWQLFT